MCALETRSAGHLGHCDRPRGETTHSRTRRVLSTRHGCLAGIHVGESVFPGPVVVRRDVHSPDIPNAVTGSEDLL